MGMTAAFARLAAAGPPSLGVLLPRLPPLGVLLPLLPSLGVLLPLLPLLALGWPPGVAGRGGLGSVGVPLLGCRLLLACCLVACCLVRAWWRGPRLHAACWHCFVPRLMQRSSLYCVGQWLHAA